MIMMHDRLFSQAAPRPGRTLPRRGGSLWCGLVALMWALTCSTAHAQSSPQALAQQLLDEADVIVEQVGQLRGISALGPVKKSVRTREALRAELETRIAEEIKPEEIEAETRTLVAMGLLPPNFDYAAFFVELLTEQIAGFYDDDAKELALIADNDDLDEQRMVMAHELFHAVQDQRFDLKSVSPPQHGLAGAERNGDRALARSALLEGDATALMIDYMGFRMGSLPLGSGASLLDNPMVAASLGAMAGELDAAAAGESPVMASAPAWIREQLVFPYMSGLKFVAAMRQPGSWARLNAVYLDPPDSTEQILHPERYLDRDEPQLVSLDVDAVISALAPRRGEAWTHVYDDVLGELSVRLWLAHHLDDASLAHLLGADLTIHQAAEGWDGDRYHTITAGEHTLWISISVWDRPQDAAEFAAAMSAMLHTRFPDARRTQRRGEFGGHVCLQSATARHYVERWGDWALVIQGIPPEQDLKALRDAIWSTRRAGPYPRTITQGPGLGASPSPL